MMVVFEKGMALRHIGHLDLMRTIQRALRRSGLPIRYSNGFNPHIQLSFAAPLSVGVVGMREVMDVPIEGEYPAAEFLRILNEVLPACLQARSARAVSEEFPTLMALVAGSRIRVELEASPEAERVVQMVPRFMQGGETITLRKTKSGENLCNIRPFVAEASVEPSPDGYTLRCLIVNQPSGSLKPAVLLQALCEMAQVEHVDALAYRDAILARDESGALIALEEYAYA